MPSTVKPITQENTSMVPVDIIKTLTTINHIDKEIISRMESAMTPENLKANMASDVNDETLSILENVLKQYYGLSGSDNKEMARSLILNVKSKKK